MVWKQKMIFSNKICFFFSNLDLQISARISVSRLGLRWRTKQNLHRGSGWIQGQVEGSGIGVYYCNTHLRSTPLLSLFLGRFWWHWLDHVVFQHMTTFSHYISFKTTRAYLFISLRKFKTTQQKLETSLCAPFLWHYLPNLFKVHTVLFPNEGSQLSTSLITQTRRSYIYSNVN